MKPKDRTKESKAQPTEAPVKRAIPTKMPVPRDPNAIRTVVISGLPETVDSKTLWKKVRKLEGAEKVEWPVKVGDVEEIHTGTLNTQFYLRSLTCVACSTCSFRESCCCYCSGEQTPRTRVQGLVTVSDSQKTT